MDLLLTVGAGIAALFFVSIVIVFLSSWILGRSRGYSAYASAAQYYSRHEEFGELEDSPVRSAKSYTAEETPQNNAMDNSLIQEILSVELPDEVPSSTHASVQTPLKAEEPPKNPLVSLIEEFDFSEDGDSASEASTEAPPEDDSFRELLGEDEEVSAPEITEVEKRSYTSYPDCFGNEKNCNKNCGYAEECKRTVEILGEFI
jgi:hypothetical protein